MQRSTGLSVTSHVGFPCLHYKELRKKVEADDLLLVTFTTAIPFRYLDDVVRRHMLDHVFVSAVYIP